MGTADAIALTGVLAAIFAFVTGLIQYTKAQRWKRLEYVADEIKEAFAQKSVQQALQFLDWNSNTYDLREHKDEKELKEVWVDDAVLEHAMVPHSERHSGFSIEEIRIRAAFDALFEVLRRFEHFIEVGLVRPSDFEPYLRYWLQRLSSPSKHGKQASLLRVIWRYIDFYEYIEVKRFVARYGYDSHKLLRPSNDQLTTR